MRISLSPALDLLRRAIPSLAGVYLFGSQATGTAGPDSDVDIAFFAGRALPQADLLRLREQVSAVLRHDVDLVDLAGASTIMQMQVLRDGRLEAAPDPNAIGLFELRVLRDYRDLKMRRAGIEADIVARGRVYGG